MSETNQTNDYLNFPDEGKPKLPTGLNILTILTFIGCALGLFGGIWQFASAEKGYNDLMKMQDKMGDLPPIMRKMIGPDALETARKSMENKVPVLLLTLAGVGLCLYGAIEMRKLKKQGFTLWAAGEFLPIVGGFIFIGSGMLSGFALFALLFPIAFLIMYAVNKKHLIY
ncbi:MAG: hypothetical protein V4685_11675 [Bacteroidota bacterium]